MKCTEASNLFGDAIDGTIPQSIRTSLQEHFGVCRPCRRAYELEVITKDVVRRRCLRVTTPPEILQAVAAKLENPSQPPVLFLEWVQDVFTVRRVLPALALSIAVVILLVFYNSPNAVQESDVHTASNDVIFQSLQNFEKLQKGELTPAVHASRAEEVHQYLDDSGMDFAFVQPLDCCKSYGALTSEYDGIKLAQVVYTMGRDVMYVYQVKKEKVFDGSTLIIPPAARTALEKTGWYTDPRHPNCNVILWIKDQTLCAAVSSMKKDEMLAILNRN
jgi:hypothetical protein